MSGNFIKIATIDLTSGSIGDYPVNSNYYREYIGGSAFSARLFLDLASPDVDPLSPENPMIIMTGPLVGTKFPGTSRFTVCAKSPQTGIWGESSSGGAFGSVLKRCGLDGLIISGCASSPVVVQVIDGNISLKNAGDLWGLDSFETIDRLQEIYADHKKLKSLVIGPAGENRVKFAAICNDKANYLGRVGMGAVMGSKNLKAIVVDGNQTIPLVDEVGFNAARKSAIEAARESIVSMSLNQVGTASAMEIGMMTGDVPIKNWSVGLVDELGEELGGNTIAETILKKRKACFACPIACKPEVEIKEGKYAIGTAPGPEFETLGTFGSMTMTLDLKAVSKANDLCNRLGLDSISCGATIAFVMEAREKGYYSDKDLDGLNLDWGDGDGVIELVKKIAYRQGFGDKAAEGSASLAANLPKEAEAFLVAIKGLELPMHDPRAFHGMGLAYMMSNRGACHLQHSCQAIEQGSVSWPQAGLEDEYAGIESEGKAKMVYLSEGIGLMANNICICHFAQWAIGLELTLDGLNTATGYGLSLQEFIDIGHNSWLLKRSLNNLMGVTSNDDKLPDRILMPLEEGGTEGTVPDEELLKSEYYQVRGLDTRGFPLDQILEEAKLDFLIPMLNQAKEAS
ncbi:aldehyde ferredoxin oxidoreductase family protein [bacterium]|nr:aldehyde ferredoxin oxidoreductase family protein [bacterium]